MYPAIAEFEVADSVIEDNEISGAVNESVMMELESSELNDEPLALTATTSNL